VFTGLIEAVDGRHTLQGASPVRACAKRELPGVRRLRDRLDRLAELIDIDSVRRWHR
jgi:hypothetical protein